MRCEELMTPEPEIVRTDDTVRIAAAKMRDANIGFLPVLDDLEQLVGVVTDRDLAVRALAEALPAETPVEEVMTVDVVTCNPDDDLRRVERLMRVNQKGRLAVVDDAGRLVGVISLSDIIAQNDDVGRPAPVAGDVAGREASVP
jgi:CBS domain-containing protein